MDAKSGRSINEYTKEELLSAPERKWDTVLENIAGVPLIRGMARLIDLIVQDCIALDIPTKDPDELEKLVKEWCAE